MSLHINYCSSFGIARAEIEATPEHQACTAYTRYVLDVGASEDWLGLQVALAPCLLGYGAVARQLHADPRTVRSAEEGNVYWEWILNYVADDYVQAVETGSGECSCDSFGGFVFASVVYIVWSRTRRATGLIIPHLHGEVSSTGL